MLQTIALIVGAGVLNLSYFICGLFDSRITALARKRHSKDGYLIDLCRFAVLISLQVMFYVAVNLGQYEAFSRLSIHVISIAFLYIGTKMSVIGLTGGIACGKSTVVDLLVKLSSGHIKIIDSDKIVHGLYEDADFI